MGNYYQIGKDSWMGQLMQKYRKILRDGDVDQLDKANKTVCNALDKITRIKVK